MRKILVYTNANIPDGGKEIEFEVENDVTDDRIREEALQAVINLVNWYWVEARRYD
jgi:hypothetical protein|nr:MAG TPA: hypothetical protein [Caudoviricetes sp.]